MKTTKELENCRKLVGASIARPQHRRLDYNKGITMIALVITIVVMLILVSVTISMAVNGGLFEYAGKAAQETQNAINKEQMLAEGKIEKDGIWYDSMDDYIAGTPHKWTRGTELETRDIFTCSHCDAKFTMGEVVNYTATGETTIYMDRLGYPDAEENEIGITSQNTKWIVFGIEDTDKDGDVYETLLITSEEPLMVLDNSTGFSFCGAAAYNNGPSEINRICRELYSNSKYGYARGMTIEDVNSALNFTPPGGIYVDLQGNYQTTGDFTTKLNELPANIWEDIIDVGTSTPDPNDKDTKDDLAKYELNGYMYMLADELSLTNLIDEETIPITEIERNTIFGPYVEDSGYSYVYHLASRGFGCTVDIGNAGFGSGAVAFGAASSAMEYLALYGNTGEPDPIGLRPVVPLKTKLPTVTE